MLHESFRVPSNVHPVQTATMTGESVQMGPLQTQTSKSAPAVAPPGIMQPVVPTIHGLNQGLPHSRATGSNPVIIKDPITGQPTLVSKTMGLSLGTGPEGHPKPMKGVSLIQPHLLDRQQIPCLRMLPLVGGGGGGGSGDTPLLNEFFTHSITHHLHRGKQTSCFASSHSHM